MQARYTEYLRDLMRNEHTRQALESALSTYPLHIPKNKQDLIPTREELNKRILNHYKYREIGFETVGRFLDELEITMCEIMPYYNERFKTIEVMAEIENPFDTVDLVETFEQETSSTSTSEGTSSNTESNEGTSEGTTSAETASRAIESDTPGNDIAAGSLDEVSYASRAEWGKGSSQGSENRSSSGSSSSEGSTSGSSSSEGITRHTYTKRGAQGVTTFGHDMIEFRDSIIDVMNEIVTDSRLEELFMIVY